jgi:hypothetical protein
MLRLYDAQIPLPASRNLFPVKVHSVLRLFVCVEKEYFWSLCRVVAVKWPKAERRPTCQAAAAAAGSGLFNIAVLSLRRKGATYCIVLLLYPTENQTVTAEASSFARMELYTAGEEEQERKGLKYHVKRGSDT